VTIHYHGGPFTPLSVLYELAGEHFCVSHAYPQQVARMHEIGQSVMIDNGAYSQWKSGKATDWAAYYEWTDRWLDCPTTWAVIPDLIEGEGQEQDALIREWPHGHRGAPVWHMHEGVYRLLNLIDAGWPKVCVGSSGAYATVLSEAWCRRMDEAWNEVARTFKRLPWLHMLRGMQLAGRHYPFASLDSTDVAQNHNRPHNSAPAMARRWNAQQTPGRWETRPLQMELV